MAQFQLKGKYSNFGGSWPSGFLSSATFERKDIETDIM